MSTEIPAVLQRPETVKPSPLTLFVALFVVPAGITFPLYEKAVPWSTEVNIKFGSPCSRAIFRSQKTKASSCFCSL
jgi:hypothetical protein